MVRRYPRNPGLKDKLTAAGFELVELDQKRAWSVEKAWLEVYARHVKHETGSWVVDRFHWHGFSNGFEKYIEGEEAFAALKDQWPVTMVLFDEAVSFCYEIAATSKFEQLIEICRFGDLYLSHHNMKWTIAFTHEDGWYGPYFSSREIIEPSD